MNSSSSVNPGKNFGHLVLITLEVGLHPVLVYPAIEIRLLANIAGGDSGGIPRRRRRARMRDRKTRAVSLASVN